MRLVICCPQMRDLIDAKQVRVESVTPDTYVPVGVFSRHSMTYAHINYCMFCGKKIEVKE